MKAERFALLLVIVLVIGVPLAAAIVARSNSDVIEIHAQMADNGGWTPGNLTAQVGQPLHLRMTSDDVMHGFAVGQSATSALDVLPGQWTTTTLVFDQPGKYTFYCTRWCGPNHWRMRGTIEVTGDATNMLTTTPPLYITLNLDLDAPHPSDVVPGEKPSATRGATLDFNLDRLPPPNRAQSPAQLWQQLRSANTTGALSDQQIWDLIAWTYRSRTTPERLGEGRQLYQQNCAACHGENGDGNGAAARFLYPKPRNFREGQFRLVTTANRVPSDKDLMHVLVRGMPGSAMFPMGHLVETERKELVAHVRRLIRAGLEDRLRREDVKRLHAMPFSLCRRVTYPAPAVRYARGSAMRPSIALAAAVSGEARKVRAPFP